MDKIPLLGSNTIDNEDSADDEYDNLQNQKLKSSNNIPHFDLKPISDYETDAMPYYLPSSIVSRNKSYKQEFRHDVTFASLAIAVQDHDIDQLEMILAQKKINFVDTNGLNILHIAMCWGNDEVIKLLLDHPQSKALINKPDEKGITPLMYAVQYNKCSAVELLCSHGADTTLSSSQKGETALHYAIRADDPKLAEILLKYNSTTEFVNKMNAEGETALTNAIQFKSSAVDSILNCGADYTQPNIQTGRTALHTIVAHNRIHTLKKILLNPKSTIEFIENTDCQGDSALMLAVQIGELKLIEMLTQHITQISGVNYKTNKTVLHVAISKSRPDIVKHLLPYMTEFILNYPDNNGRTPLLYSIELGCINCLEVLLDYGVDVKKPNTRNGETIVHATVQTKSISILNRILALDNIKYFFNIKDMLGNTPHIAAIKAGNAVCLKRFLQVGWVDLSKQIQEGDTPTYYAAKHGFFDILQALLLSSDYYSFCGNNESKFDIDDEQVILDAEIRGEIYASDVYILLGKKIKFELVPWFPSYIFLPSKQNRNIFHACALGGNIKCLEFMYNYFKIFNQKVNIFDKAGVNGNTPLLLAAQFGQSHLKCVYFFLQHHANLSATNSDKLDVVKALTIHMPQHKDLLITILDNGVLEALKKSHNYKENIGIDFRTLCPKNENQMKVITLLYKNIKGPESEYILEHPVIRGFLYLKWEKAGQIFIIRFVLSLISALILTFFLTVKISQEFQNLLNPYTSVVYRTASIFISFTSILGLCFSIPQLTNINILWYIALIIFLLMLLPSLASFFVVFLSNNFPFLNELCGIAVLTSWLSFILYSINIFEYMSQQVAMFSGVMFRILRHLVMFFLVLMAFSFSFFCIFNEDRQFANPFISFIYTTLIILPGKLNDLPIFTTRHPFKNFKYGEFIIECTILLMFMISASIGLLNMLVGVAIRGGMHLEKDGRIFRKATKVKWLNDFEILYSKRWFSFIEKARLSYLIGIPSNMKQTRNVALIYRKVQDKNGKLLIPNEHISEMMNVLLHKAKNKLKLKITEQNSGFQKVQNVETDIDLILGTGGEIQLQENISKLKQDFKHI